MNGLGLKVAEASRIRLIRSLETMNWREAVAFLTAFKAENPAANKADVEAALIAKCHPEKERSVFLGDGYAMRFCEANTPSFSNVVLSLSALHRHDAVPVLICIVRPDRLEFRLANSTFLKRVSHSSHALRSDNIRGSFLGHDIMEQYEGTRNLPEHFDELFAFHSAFTWEENVERLVEATNAIVARDMRFKLTSAALAQVLRAPAAAAAVLGTERFIAVERELCSIVDRRREDLIAAVSLDNVNLRGNTIEQIITGEGNAHRFDDLLFDLGGGQRLTVDIKTKLLDRSSAPKAYNIDKMLALLSQPGNVFGLFFIGLDGVRKSVHTRLVSVFDPVIINATRVQTHWAGRASRGVTQFTGDLTQLFADAFRPSVDINGGLRLLREFAER